MAGYFVVIIDGLEIRPNLLHGLTELFSRSDQSSEGKPVIELWACPLSFERNPERVSRIVQKSAKSQDSQFLKGPHVVMIKVNEQELEQFSRVLSEHLSGGRHPEGGTCPMCRTLFLPRIKVWHALLNVRGRVSSEFRAESSRIIATLTNVNDQLANIIDNQSVDKDVWNALVTSMVACANRMLQGASHSSIFGVLEVLTGTLLGELNPEEQSRLKFVLRGAISSGLLLTAASLDSSLQILPSDPLASRIKHARINSPEVSNLTIYGQIE